MAWGLPYVIKTHYVRNSSNNLSVTCKTSSHLKSNFTHSFTDNFSQHA